MRKELKYIFNDDTSPDEIVRARVDCPFSKGNNDPHYVDVATKQRQILVIKSTCDRLDKDLAQSAEALQGHTCKALKDIVVENTLECRNYYDRVSTFDRYTIGVTNFANVVALRSILDKAKIKKLKEEDCDVEIYSPEEDIKSRINYYKKLDALASLVSDFDYEDILIGQHERRVGEYELRLKIKWVTVATREEGHPWKIEWPEKDKLRDMHLEGFYDKRCHLCRKTVKNMKQHCSTEMHSRAFNFNVLKITSLLKQSNKPINYKLIRKKNPDLNIATAVRELCDNKRMPLKDPVLLLSP